MLQPSTPESAQFVDSFDLAELADHASETSRLDIDTVLGVRYTLQRTENTKLIGPGLDDSDVLLHGLDVSVRYQAYDRNMLQALRMATPERILSMKHSAVHSVLAQTVTVEPVGALNVMTSPNRLHVHRRKLKAGPTRSFPSSKILRIAAS